MTSTAELTSPASADQIIDAEYSLDHKYSRDAGRIYLSGVQALVRLPLLQKQRDTAEGLATAGFISGYRGSPLGGFDLELWRAKKHLAAAQVRFTPGINEDLAATMVWGTQQANLWPGAKHDGVFSMWYGKGPGVDRCGDVFKHANAAGTSPHGGVLALAADDHACRSSTLPHGSEHEFESAFMPVLNPTSVQDILDLGLYGFAMSRFTGRWVGFKTIAETVESSASVDVDPDRIRIVLPEDFVAPPGGLGIRWPDPPLDQELRLHQYATAAAHAFARANQLDRVVVDSPHARLGIVTTGKSYLDVLQALEYLGIDERACRDIGIRIYKVAMTWPLEPTGILAFARGLEDILVVEEKRAFIESQMKEAMYNLGETNRPSVVGKYDEAGDWILPSTSELTPARIARVIAKRLARFHRTETIEAKLAFLAEKERELALPRANFPRVPHYCSGCPHNTSTVVPEGSRALGGIGCHYMVTWMDRQTETFTQMGGEGATWCGQAPFTNTPHIFQNLGDGTYFHSGSLAIRQAVAARVNITYKILYNDAVAMTGGQPVDGELSVPDIAHQVRAEGVATIVVLSDDPARYTRPDLFPAGVEILDRDMLDVVQKRLRETPGVTILIFDQTCAAELRRRRKRGKAPDPAKRVMINSLVCEGCGDCSVKSNCISVLPLETEYGRKRSIDQSNCNKDFSCIKGFCPSFVTVHGAPLAKRQPRGIDALDAALAALPDRSAVRSLDTPWNILVTGVGGTGVVTIGALIGMAAHLEGLGATVLDQTGLAQKGGAVTTHVRIGATPGSIHAVRIAAGEADLVLGCDQVVVNDYWALSKIRAGRTRVVLNDYEAMPGPFQRNPDMQFPAAGIRAAITTALGGEPPELLAATDLATRLFGDAIATNLFMLGFAWQRGLVPVTLTALMRAIELNGVAIEANRRAFAIGRLAAVDRVLVHSAAGLAIDRQIDPGDASASDIAPLPPGTWEGQEFASSSAPVNPTREDELTHVRGGGTAAARPWSADREHSTSLDELIARRVEFLTAYQNRAYAMRFTALVERVRAVERERVPDSRDLTETVARHAFKLMAYKDEWEVARLHADKSFHARLRETFQRGFKLRYHLAPPLLSRRDANGHLIKREFGGWMRWIFRLMAPMRVLRGRALDPFARTAERRMERQLIEDYFSTVGELIEALVAENHALAVEIAELPDAIRGFGHVKDAHLARVRPQWQRLMQLWREPPEARRAA